MADTPPPIPTEISANGHEIWDWAGKLSAHIQRLDNIRRLKAAIYRSGKECGDCDKWMKSSECPREHNIGGRTHGPSCGSPTCLKYVDAPMTIKHRISLQAELVALESSPP